MIRIVTVNGTDCVAGLLWKAYWATSAKGVEIQEKSFDFDGAAYLTEIDLESEQEQSKKKLLAGGYIPSEDLLADVDAPDRAALLGKPSLMLWFLDVVGKDDRFSNEGGVSGIFQIKLDETQYWLAAVKNSKPLPFEASDKLTIGSQLTDLRAGLQEQAEDIRADLDIFEIDASEFFGAKPSRQVGVIKKSRTSSAATAFQLLIVFALLCIPGYIAYLELKPEPQAQSRGPSQGELKASAVESYRGSLKRDFGWLTGREAYAQFVKATENVPVSAENWEFLAVACDAYRGNCIFRFDSPGYGTPSILETAINSSVEVNLGGREALYRKPFNLSASIQESFSVPPEQEVRSSLLDASAFLRSPAIGLTVEILVPEQVEIKNGSFLQSATFSAAYSKGSISVSGELGLMDLAAETLSLPGVRITELVVNNNEFALRGHYAFD